MGTVPFGKNEMFWRWMVAAAAQQHDATAPLKMVKLVSFMYLLPKLKNKNAIQGLLSRHLSSWESYLGHGGRQSPGCHPAHA